MLPWWRGSPGLDRRSGATPAEKAQSKDCSTREPRLHQADPYARNSRQTSCASTEGGQTHQRRSVHWARSCCAWRFILRKRVPAPGVDGQSYEDAAGLDENLWDLYRQLKERDAIERRRFDACIPKANGKLPGVGASPRSKDRVVQRPWPQVLSATRTGLLGMLAGFRPEAECAHGATTVPGRDAAPGAGITGMSGEVDVVGYFDPLI